MNASEEIIHLVLADDDSLMREGIRAILWRVWMGSMLVNAQIQTINYGIVLPEEIMK